MRDGQHGASGNALRPLFAEILQRGDRVLQAALDQMLFSDEQADEVLRHASGGAFRDGLADPFVVAAHDGELRGFHGALGLFDSQAEILCRGGDVSGEQ